MNYLRPEILEPLAERYVLGTMPWRARRRFDRIVDEHDIAMREVYRIEASLLPRIWSLPPVSPSQLVWPRIFRDISSGKGSSRDASRSAWPAVASALGIALLVSVAGWWQSAQQPPDTIVETVVETVTEIQPLEPAVAVINGADGRALWVALVYEDLSRADIEVTTAPEAVADNDYELWILDAGGVPASMGLLPQTGKAVLNLDANAVTALRTGNTLAVSLEPLGGSREAGPTGPVLFTAALLTR